MPGALSKVRHLLHIDSFVETVNAMSCQELLFVFVSVMMVISGYAGQLLVMNLWLNNMGTISPNEAPITLLTSTAVSTTLFFGGALVFRVIVMWKTISFRFLLCKKGIFLSIALGFTNAIGGILMVYAAPNTLEIMQTLLICTQVFWTLAAAKLFLGDERSLLNALVIASFLCVAGGIVLGASPSFTQSDAASSSPPKSKWWTLIYFVSVIPAALFNVFASMFMREFTEEPQAASVEDGSPLLLNSPAGNIDDNAKHARADDTTVKLTMLVALSFGLVFWAFALLPLNAAPWFGPSKNFGETQQALKDGWSCVFQGTHGCAHTYIYFILFNVSYFLFFFGSSYLNHFSAALNSMVSQLATPIAAIVLMIAPSLNVDAEAVSVGASVGAVILMIVGSVLFTLWEHGTRKG